MFLIQNQRRIFLKMANKKSKKKEMSDKKKIDYMNNALDEVMDKSPAEIEMKMNNIKAITGFSKKSLEKELKRKRKEKEEKQNKQKEKIQLTSEQVYEKLNEAVDKEPLDQEDIINALSVTSDFGKTLLKKELKKLIKKKKEKEKEDKGKDILKDYNVEKWNQDLKDKIINYVPKDQLDGIDNIRLFLKNSLENQDNLYFVSNYEDKISGKPVLVKQNKEKIPLVFKTKKKSKDDEGEEKEEKHIKLFDEPYSLKFDGEVIDRFCVSFWIYRVIDKGEEYFVLSQKELSNQLYNFRGMKIEMSDRTEASETLSISSVKDVFIMYDATPSTFELGQEELVELTKDLKKNLGWGEEGFKKFLFTHPEDLMIYRNPLINEELITAVLLSGKKDGYPLHLMEMGNVSVGKTIKIECLDSKFKEYSGICEASNSTPKILIPSFASKPANAGYILNSVRISLIDELMKMFSNISQQSQYENLISSYMNQLNYLLEHKKRTVGSGNNNSLTAKATSQAIFQTNPLPNKTTLSQHMDFIDYTTMSRMVIYVLPKEHERFILNNKPQENESEFERNYISKRDLELSDLYEWKGKKIDPFLTIYDSCKGFLCDIDESILDDLWKHAVSQVREPLKSIIKTKRYRHHFYLLLDGLIKKRCLFSDGDKRFKATQEDYVNFKKLISEIVKSWYIDMDTDDFELNDEFSKEYDTE